MITLNLIPPEKKQMLNLLVLYQTIKNIIFIILLASIGAAIILLLTKMALQNHFEDMVEQTTLTTRYANIFSSEVKSFNRYLQTAEQVKNQHISWIILLDKLTKKTPQNITIDSISNNKEILLITGFSPTREDLLTFESNLKSLDIFKVVAVPLENLLTKENISFTIKIVIDFEKLASQTNEN
jgi:Tfp pilus assembly protein PilN